MGMKKFFGVFAGLVFLMFNALTGQAELGMQWLNPVSNRVEAMGGAAAGTVDESTDLTLLNLGNPAGLAFGRMENRLDLNYNYLYADMHDSQNSQTMSFNGISNPGGGYRGLTCWLTDSLVINGSGEGEIANMGMHESGMDDINEKIYGGEGEIRIAGKINNISIGGAFGIAQYDINTDPYSDVAKMNVAAKHFAWRVGAEYANKFSKESGEFNLGVFFGTDDQKPNFLIYPSLDPDHIYGSYEVAQDIQINENSYWVGKYNMHYDNLFSPKLASLTAIYKLRKLLEIGMNVNFIQGSSIYKYQSSYDPPIYPLFSSEYTEYDYNSVGLTPIIKGVLPLTDNLDMTWCAIYSTEGSNRTNNYLADYNTPDPNDTYKYSTTDAVANNFAIGIGCQTKDEKLSLAIQFDQQRIRYKNHFDEPKSALDVDTEDEFRHQAARIGIEFKPFSAFSIRGGYAAMLDSDTRANLTNSQANSQTNRFSLGLGLKVADKTSIDITGIEDAIKPNPGLVYEAEALRTIVLAGLKQLF
jgi:hypothetical protein